MREIGVNGEGKGECTAEVVVRFWTEKGSRGGVQCERQTRGERRVVARGDTVCGKEEVAVSLICNQSYPSSLICLPPHCPVHQPPSLLVCPCQCLKMHVSVCLSLSIVMTVVSRLVSAGSPGDRLRVLTHWRCRLCGPGLVTEGLFFPETGLSLLRFRPLLCFP